MSVSGLPLADARKIGFNDPVEVEGHTFNVQTEVLTRGKVVIRTVVLDGGVVRMAENRPCPPDLADLEALITIVKSQHGELLNRVRLGGVSWLAST